MSMGWLPRSEPRIPDVTGMVDRMFPASFASPIVSAIAPCSPSLLLFVALVLSRIGLEVTASDSGRIVQFPIQHN